MVRGRWGMVSNWMVGSLVFGKSALAIEFVVTLATVERVGVRWLWMG